MVGALTDFVTRSANEHRHSGFVEGNRVGEQKRRVRRLLALEAFVVVMLRQEPQVTADLDRGAGEGIEDAGLRPFEFDDIAAGLDQAAGAFDRDRGRVVAAIGQIGDDHGFGRASAHRADVVAHVGEGDVPLAGVAQNIGADAVADENNIDASGLLGLGGRGVIGCQHGDRLALSLHGEKSGDFTHQREL